MSAPHLLHKTLSKFLYQGSSHRLSPEEMAEAENSLPQLGRWLEAIKIYTLCLALTAWAYLPGCVRDVLSMENDTVVSPQLLTRLVIVGLGGLIWGIYLLWIVADWCRRTDKMG